MQNDSLDDIREKVFSGYPFALSNEEKDILGKINTKSIPLVVSECRQKLEYLGNRSCKTDGWCQETGQHEGAILHNFD